MSKWYGIVGYATTEEVEPGIYDDSIKERPYYGDVLSNRRRLQNSGEVNDDINISNQISIVADPFAYQNFHAIRYAEFMGSRWKVTEIDVQSPRLVLTLGGVYNG